MLGQKFCEKLNGMERARGGLVRAVHADGKIAFTVQAADRDAAVREIVGAAFHAGVLLDVDAAGAVWDNGDGTFTAHMAI